MPRSLSGLHPACLRCLRASAFIILAHVLSETPVAETERTRLIGQDLESHVLRDGSAVGIDHEWGANWKATFSRDGKRRLIWKVSPIKHGYADGMAHVINDQLCITYPAIKHYQDLCSAVYFTGDNRYELWREGRHAETYYVDTSRPGRR